MGQDRTNGAIRSMANPNAFNDPDTYKGTNWFTGTADAGGVHTNSGVQNFWFFLLSQGGSGTNDKGWAYSVSGIGRAKASAIAYRNLTVYLGANSTYNDARTGAISAAADLYGANSAEQQAVIKAWRAVGIDPCELTCPSDVVVANDAGQCGATVNFAATTDNGECFTVTTSPASGTFFAVGTTSVTSTATSGASCTFNVTVNDTEDPSITCPANIVQANDTGQCGAIVTFTPTASDNCPGVTTSSSPPSGSFFPVGVTQVTSTATDAAGNDVSCNFTVTVQDTEKPTITVGLSPGILWPPDHKLDTIEADVDIADNCPGATFILLSITCDEAVDGHGDGSTLPDIVGATTGTADTEFELRAERDGSGDGRDYTIVYKVTDASNNTAEATGHVFVQQETPGSLASVSGLTSNGRAVDPKAGSVVFMIPSLTSPDGVTFDAASIVSTGIVLGNSGGVIAVESDQLSDLSNDGMSDRVLSFPAQPLRNLTAPGAIEPVALRYLTQNGESYLVPDVLALGRPMRSGKGGTEVLTSDGSKVGSSVSKTGLMGSSPSPFAASTRLDYGLVRSTAVRIDVYDVSGRLVRPLVSSFETAGSHSVNWDGLDDSGHRLGNGVYFIRFEADGVRDNLRVVRMN
jgi:hypothetical protein